MDVEVELLETFGDASGEVSARPKVSPKIESSGVRLANE
jgi:hypothetical protein